MNVLLKGKRAVVFGAGGSIGARVAKEFAAEGAEVFLSGRSKPSVEATAREIAGAGGCAHVAVVDVTDATAVESYFDSIAGHAATIDVMFNAAGPSPRAYGNGKLAVDLSVEEFGVPLAEVVQPQFITARAAARRMTKQRSGVILFQTGSPARGHTAGATSIGTAFGAIETLAENLAFEVSPLGVRIVCLRTTANADTEVIQQTAQLIAAMENTTKDHVLDVIANLNFLKTRMSVADTAHALAFLASERARTFTATVVNASAGAALD